MDLIYDLADNTLQLLNDEPGITLKWRGREPVRIQFRHAGVPGPLPVGYGLAYYLVRQGELLAEITDWTTPGSADGFYTGILILHTSALSTLFEDEELSTITADVEIHVWSSGAASTPAISDSEIAAQIRRPSILPEPAAVEVLEGAEEWLEERAARWHPGITGLTGGGATKLDGLITFGKEKLLVTLWLNSELQDWLLIAGTDAENTAAGIVRPDDFDAEDNAQVWKRVR